MSFLCLILKPLCKIHIVTSHQEPSYPARDARGTRPFPSSGQARLARKKSQLEGVLNYPKSGRYPK